jgi:uncharacterized membrane protein YkvA (DUF1232 family)
MIAVHELAAAAKRLKSETLALYLATRDPRTPWLARLVAAAVVAYAFSPIDLIPDFVPVLGYLDDLILVPLGLALAIRLIPAPVLADCRIRARELAQRPVSRVAAVVIVVVWLAVVALVAWWLAGALRLV